MDGHFLLSTLATLTINLVYTIVVLVIAVMALKYIDRKILKEVHLEEEIRKGNIAAAIVASTFLIFVAIIVAASIS
ncbi:DUF350 domain-containing protein [Hydrogenimonas sp.]|jgi:uncharacterized membrane protein YjfL (UPF0719 family)